jgi:hypothetical protein
MIIKESVLDSLITYAAILLSGSSAIAFFTGFNPWHGVIGAVGQWLYLTMEYVRSQKSGLKVKKKTILFLVSVTIIGAALGFLTTGWAAEKIGLPELIVGVGIGFFAQAVPELYDTVVDLFIGFIKKKYSND